MRRILWLGLITLVFCSCAHWFEEKDYALERYKQYSQNLNAAVEREELTAIQAETLDLQAFNQYMIIRQQQQQMQNIQQTQVLGAISGMASKPSEPEGQIINQSQKVYCTNC